MNAAALCQVTSELSETTVSIALLECQGVAIGLRLLDLMLKRSPITVFEANLVEPGKYVILIGGGVAEVEEALDALCDHHSALLSNLHIPMVHADIWSGLKSSIENTHSFDTLGVVETNLIAGALVACDRALKESYVRLHTLRFGVALGGRGYFIVEGTQHDVEAALDSARKAAQNHGGVLSTECIPRPDDDLIPWLLRDAPFRLQSH